MRAALYARFSSDLQNVASIADQFAACRQLAERLGATVVQEHCDAAISGAVTSNRPGLQALMATAEAGAIDVVICEALDRLTRSGGDAWAIYDDLKACGVAIHTIAEGEAQTLHIGLKGTMNALFLEELGRKTRRGQAGVARSGRHGGGAPPYGYRRVHKLDDQGVPIGGLLEIDEARAAVVIRVFEDYAAGKSPRAIAASLNAEGIAGPRTASWNASTINGNAKRGNGLLHNELYAGVMVWGRHTWVKDRRTGKRRARDASADQVVRQDVPELRIVPADLWTEVRQRYAEASRATRPEGARRPKRLLSGLVKCGICGGPMTFSGPGGRMQCTTHRERGSTVCRNGRAANGADIEARVLQALKDNLLHPAVIEAAIAEFQSEMTKLESQAANRTAQLERDLAEVKRRAERLVDQVADGVLSGAAVSDRLRSLEARRAELEAMLTTAPSNVVRLHPAAATRYRKMVADLHDVLGTPLAATASEAQRERARAALRALVTGVVVYPEPERGKYRLELQGDLAPLLQLEPERGARLSLGAGGGFEPPTFRL